MVIKKQLKEKIHIIKNGNNDVSRDNKKIAEICICEKGTNLKAFENKGIVK